MNNFIKKARTAEKQLVTDQAENKFSSANQCKIEGIITSAIQTKTDTQEPQNPWATYYLAFFQLEGLKQDIPVIFRLKDNQKPKITSQSKVLLVGQWVSSPISPRPSFTCTEYQILANPPPITIKSLREQISQLLTTSLDKKKEWAERTDFLFRKRKDLEELDKLSKLPFEYLQAYLLLRQAHYANYQDNLLQVTADLASAEQYLTKLVGEIEETAQHIRAYQSKES